MKWCLETGNTCSIYPYNSDFVFFFHLWNICHIFASVLVWFVRESREYGERWEQSSWVKHYLFVVCKCTGFSNIQEYILNPGLNLSHLYGGKKSLRDIPVPAGMYSLRLLSLCIKAAIGRSWQFFPSSVGHIEWCYWFGNSHRCLKLMWHSKESKTSARARKKSYSDLIAVWTW